MIYVNYTVNGHDYQYGPCKDMDDAFYEKQDIAIYECVTNVHITFDRSENRTLVPQ